MITRNVLGVAAAAVVAVGLSASAHAVPWVLDFEDFTGVDFVHGTVVDTEYAAQIPGAGAGLGVTISADNPNGPDLAVAFNTAASGTRDPDLEAPFVLSTNSVGTVDLDPGHVLIIQENQWRDHNGDGIASSFDRTQTDGCDDGVCDFPDDEGGQPAGTFTFAFTSGIVAVGLDVYDIEESGGSIEFFDGATLLATVSIPTTVAGNNGAGNRGAAHIDFAAALGTAAPSGVDVVKIHLAGSGAIDKFTGNAVSVPEPASLLLFGAGLLGAGGVGLWRRRRTT